MKRRVFFVSDSTGITVESLGTSLLAQFPAMDFQVTVARYVDCREKLDRLVSTINTVAQTAPKPVVLSTLVDGGLRAGLHQANAHVFDIMGQFITPLEAILHSQATPYVGMTHGQRQAGQYQLRMDAVNFALLNDDGVSTRHYDQAQVILVGLSRSGKTPTCVYLAMQYGIFAANYPLVDEDLERLRMPAALAAHRSKLYGLGISAERLHGIRQARRPDSEYASLDQCQQETRHASRLFREWGIPVCDVSRYSVEEIATRILDTLSLEMAGVT